MKDIVKKVPRWDNKDGYYLLKDLEKHYRQRIPLTNNSAYLFVDKDDDCFIEFALLYSAGDDKDGEGVYLERVFSGSGPSGSLREMRHIWWGDEEGYTFYLPGRSVAEALTKLQEYFDFD